MTASKELTTKFEIKNSLGLHARPAAMLVQTISPFKSEITIEKDGEEVNGKSLMGILMLAAGRGTIISVKVKGPDGEQAIKAIGDLIERKFDEE